VQKKRRKNKKKLTLADFSADLMQQMMYVLPWTRQCLRFPPRRDKIAGKDPESAAYRSGGGQRVRSAPDPMRQARSPDLLDDGMDEDQLMDRMEVDDEEQQEDSMPGSDNESSDSHDGSARGSNRGRNRNPHPVVELLGDSDNYVYTNAAEAAHSKVVEERRKLLEEDKFIGTAVKQELEDVAMPALEKDSDDGSDEGHDRALQASRSDLASGAFAGVLGEENSPGKKKKKKKKKKGKGKDTHKMAQEPAHGWTPGQHPGNLGLLFESRFWRTRTVSGGCVFCFF